MICETVVTIVEILENGDDTRRSFSTGADRKIEERNERRNTRREQDCTLHIENGKEKKKNNRAVLLSYEWLSVDL